MGRSTQTTACTGRQHVCKHPAHQKYSGQITKALVLAAAPARLARTACLLLLARGLKARMSSTTLLTPSYHPPRKSLLQGAQARARLLRVSYVPPGARTARGAGA